MNVYAGYSYVGEQFSREFNTEQWDRVDSYDRLDARVSWVNADGNLSVTGWVKNITDERNVIRYDTVSTVTRMQNANLSDPLTAGIQFRYEFE